MEFTIYKLRCTAEQMPALVCLSSNPLIGFRIQVFCRSICIAASNWKFFLVRGGRVTRCVCEKMAQMKPKTFFVKINTYKFYHGEKYQKIALFMQFSKKLPNENNRPTGENSPNLVALFEGLPLARLLLAHVSRFLPHFSWLACTRRPRPLFRRTTWHARFCQRSLNFGKP
jgi:hypothetical protein